MLLAICFVINGRSAAIAIACNLAPLAYGQTREAGAAKNACSPIIAAAVTAEPGF